MRGISSFRHYGVLFLSMILGLPAASQSTADFTDPLTAALSTPVFTIDAAKYSFTASGLQRSQSDSGTTNGTDRPMVKSVASNYLSLQNWKFEIDVAPGASNQDLIYIGFGQAIPNTLVSNEPTNGFHLRIHSGGLGSNQIHAAVVVNNATHFLALDTTTLGTLSQHPSKTTFVITRAGDNLTLSVGTQPGVTFSISQHKSSLGLTNSNGFLYFGNTSQTTVFSNAKFTETLAAVTDFTDPLTAALTSPVFTINAAKYSFTASGLQRSQSDSGTANGVDRPMVKSVASNYLSLQNWKFEIEVTPGASNQDLIYIGLGQAVPNTLVSNEPANGFHLRIHSGGLGSNQIHAAVVVNNATHFLALDTTTLGTLPQHPQKTKFLITRAGDNLTLSVAGQPGVTFSIAQYATQISLNNANARLYFGNTSETTVFSNAKFTLTSDTATNFTDSLAGPSTPFITIDSTKYRHRLLPDTGLIRFQSDSQFNLGSDKPMIKTVSGEFLTLQDWIFEVEVTSASGDDLIYMGFGQGTSNSSAGNEPSGFIFRTHSLVKSSFFRIDAAALGTTGSFLPSTLKTGLGQHDSDSTIKYIITRSGDDLTFSSQGLSPEITNHTFSISKHESSLGLDGTNGRLFFGNTSESTTFNNLKVQTLEPPAGSTTVPSITISTPTDGTTFTLGSSPPTADYSCTALATNAVITSCTGAVASTSIASGSAIDVSQRGSFEFRVNATDSRGNTSSLTHGYKVVPVDTKAPSIFITTPAFFESFFGVNDPVQAVFFCRDGLEGTGVASCVASVDGVPLVPSPDATIQLPTSTLGSHSFIVNAIDNSGNSSVSIPRTYTVLATADNTAPKIIISRPVSRTYTANAFVTASYSCQDEIGGSGMLSLSCTGTVRDREAIDTALVGSSIGKTFVVNARDKAGNPSTKSLFYFLRSVGGISPVSTSTSTGTPTAPGGVANSTLFVADTGNNRILQTDLASSILNALPITGVTLNVPTHLAHDTSSGDFLIIANTGNDEVVRVDLSTNVATVIADASDGLIGPTGVAVTATGDILISSTGSNELYELDADTLVLALLADASDGLNGPAGIELSKLGNVLITNKLENQLLEFNLITGTISVLLDALDGLNSPSDAAVKSNGNILIANSGSHQILEYDILTRALPSVVAGTGTAGSGGSQVSATSAELNNPTAISLDENDDLFIADTNNNAVRRVHGPLPPEEGSDITGPEITLAAPFNVDGYDITRLETDPLLTTIDYSCFDIESATAFCEMTVTNADGLELFRSPNTSFLFGEFVTPTDVVGSYSINLVAADSEGNVSFLSSSYNLLYDIDPEALFSGKLTKKLIKAGKKTKVNFDLGGDFGLDIFTLDPDSRQVDCADRSLALSEFEAAILKAFKNRKDNDNHTYRADSLLKLKHKIKKDGSDEHRYQFRWVTEKAWEGTCRELRLHLNDDTTPSVAVEFKEEKGHDRTGHPGQGHHHGNHTGHDHD
ncbi:MAG: NHL repeat-containing protein [Deltaproteobacteria bacterium]|nr:NHL repeat-containing protein [Deltaproteobacteria bacterium]